jgi:hypothetical protein
MLPKSARLFLLAAILASVEAQGAPRPLSQGRSNLGLSYDLMRPLARVTGGRP